MYVFEFMSQPASGVTHVFIHSFIHFTPIHTTIPPRGRKYSAKIIMNSYWWHYVSVFHNTTLNLRSRSPFAHFEHIYISACRRFHICKGDLDQYVQFLYQNDCTLGLFLVQLHAICLHRTVRCTCSGRLALLLGPKNMFEKRHCVPPFLNVGKSITTTTCLPLLHTIVVVKTNLRGPHR